MILDSLVSKKLQKILKEEEGNNKEILHLTANENVMSPLSTRFYQTELGSRYDFGPGEMGVTGGETFSCFGAPTLPKIQTILEEAKIKTNKMLHAEYSSLSCLSGLHAMICVLLATTKPGDTVMITRERDGGHFCTHKMLSITGRKFIYAIYDQQTHLLDVEKTAALANKREIKVLYFDTAVNLTPIPLNGLRPKLSKNIIIIYDASHTLGLIMGGEFQAPLLEGADIISANTHKTLPGPHKGLLAFRDQKLGQQVNNIICDSLYSTVHTNSELALAITIIEFAKYGKSYAKQVVKNSNALGSSLEKNSLIVRKLHTCYSQNHQVHVFIDGNNADIVRRFLTNGIAVNTSNALGNHLFLRLGTQEVTKRGMKEKDMEQIAFFIKQIISGKNIKGQVLQFNSNFKKISYCLPL